MTSITASSAVSTKFSKISSISSNDSNVNYTSESDNSVISIDDVFCGYVGEPEYNEDELKWIKFSENENSIEMSEDELNSSRMEKLEMV